MCSGRRFGEEGVIRVESVMGKNVLGLLLLSVLFTIIRQCDNVISNGDGRAIR